MSTADGPVAVACYRHRNRAGTVACRRCERPICTDCMISAPVGWQCPACVKAAPRVETMATMGAAARPTATFVIIGICVAAHLPSFASGLGTRSAAGAFLSRFALSGPEVAAGQWYRIVTSGFLHVDIIHLAFNMALLYQLGSVLEPRLGRPRFLALYVASLLGGSAGALLLDPNSISVGASGAVFGLMAATFVQPRSGRNAIELRVGGLLAINLVLTFAFPFISKGGHLGGLAVGLLAGLAIRLADTSRADTAQARRAQLRVVLSIGVCAVLGLVAVVLALGAAAPS